MIFKGVYEHQRHKPAGNARQGTPSMLQRLRCKPIFRVWYCKLKTKQVQGDARQRNNSSGYRKAWEGKAGRTQGRAGQGRAEKGKAGKGRERFSPEGQGKVQLGRAVQNRVGQGRARQSRVGPGPSRHSKAMYSS